MADYGSALPLVSIDIDASPTGEPLELWRHALGHGGVNPLPLPVRVIAGVRKLKPRLIRVFIQEFFTVYRGNGRFDWSRLDPYMDALRETGARIVAAIAIKPKALFPATDQAQWRPANVDEWQRVIAALARRYSVERPLVTHWEIGNEPDIGEHGGCPYLITDPEQYGEYYSMTVRPILDVCPQARVGGPALANVHHHLLPGFLNYCRRTRSRLDFVSWHLYSSSPSAHAEKTRFVRELLSPLPGPRPEMMVTEWNVGLGDAVSVEEQAFRARRAALAAAGVLEMRDAGLDWSFYYHVWDQTCFPADFAPFFSEPGVAGMARHWNGVPHRLGLFGVCQEVRPQYFVYQMLADLGDERLATQCSGDVRAIAGRAEGRVSVMAVSHCGGEAGDRVAIVKFSNLHPGPKRLTVRRIDDGRRWCPETLELQPVEERDVCTSSCFECHVLLPADSVALISLHDTGETAH